MYPESLPEWWYYPFMMFPEEEQYEYRKIYEDYKKNSN